ncbi:MAG: hypothetical protein B9S32_14655 [Verrucomicrobia bacterium Tous-C9LFEB]|nr:MAG: hypothetical protein B9S32_14655 [Verrucomicrobia bacterium Tous-C9LFEB]
MKRRILFLIAWLSGVGVACSAVPGVVEWSDGRKQEGALSLTPGKDIRLFEVKTQASIRLEDVSEIVMTPEKEEMREGFTFAEPGQAKQEKNGEIYPVRYLKAKVTLRDGKVLEGHLYTTVLYIENAEKNEKVVLLAKLTGKVGQKIEDVAYPSRIQLHPSTTAATSSCRIDLGLPALQGIESIVVFSIPDLTLLDAASVNGQVWTIPFGDPSRILYAIQIGSTVRVAWPENRHAESEIAVKASLASKEMEDFYDARELLACFYEPDEGNVYSLVLMRRTIQTHSFSKDKQPWTLAVLRWKYDTEEKKTTLLNRVQLVTGRKDATQAVPTIIPDAALLARVKATAKGGTP